MTRIIGGTAGGRSLQTPRGSGTRPTSDRVREALFSTLASRGALGGAAVLDLYAGSGALGLEAASRGASSVVLVESNRAAAAVIRGNIASLALTCAQVQQATVEAVLGRGGHAAYDLVLLDPPYAVSEPDLATVLTLLVAGGWLAPEALLVLERSSRSPEPPWPAGLKGETSKRYGETVIWFATATGGVADGLEG